MSNYTGTSGEIFDDLNALIPEPIIGNTYTSRESGHSTSTFIYDGNRQYFGKWTPGYEAFVLDINSDGTLGYYHHGHGCSHTYEEFLENATFGVTSYIYNPTIPVQQYEEITEEQIQEYIANHVVIIVGPGADQEQINNYKNIGATVLTAYRCDWRELIFQMAKDYRKYAHYTPYDENDGKEHPFTNEELLEIANNFATKIRENNGKNEDGEWRYPTGKTGYEQYYTDLEGFWRQLYCPPVILETQDYTKTGV